MKFQKMTNEQIKREQAARAHSVRCPVSLIAENIRSIHNVGSLFRTCDAAGVDKLYLCGYTSYPPRRELEKTALGSTASVNWERHEDTVHLIRRLRARGASIVVFEHAHGMRDLYTSRLSFPVCAVVGNEVSGVSGEVIALADEVLYIPMRGEKESLNVSVAGGIALYELTRRYFESSHE